MAQQCIFEYCNFGKGYLRIVFPAKKNKPTQEVTINLDDYNMVFGVVTDIDSLVLKIKEEAEKAGFSSLPSILLLLRCRPVVTLIQCQSFIEVEQGKEKLEYRVK